MLRLSSLISPLMSYPFRFATTGFGGFYANISWYPIFTIVQSATFIVPSSSRFAYMSTILSIRIE